jgi:hypothetical protein
VLLSISHVCFLPFDDTLIFLQLADTHSLQWRVHNFALLVLSVQKIYTLTLSVQNLSDICILSYMLNLSHSCFKLSSTFSYYALSLELEICYEFKLLLATVVVIYRNMYVVFTISILYNHMTAAVQVLKLIY